MNKKILSIILLVYILLFAGCKKDEEDTKSSSLEPSATQYGFAINYTATWCTYCGQWGAELIHDYSNLAPNGAIISAHDAGDPMTNSLYQSFKNDRTTTGIPTFWVGDIKTQSDDEMNTLMKSGDANAGVVYSYSISGNTMTINTKTEFFGDFTGEAYLSVLVLEDGINGNSAAGQYQQNGTLNSFPNNDYKHDFVLRKSSVSGNAFGEMITESPNLGLKVDKTYTITLDNNWINPYPVAIIWDYKSGDKPEYKYINSFKLH